jgi:hypothetical protein
MINIHFKKKRDIFHITLPLEHYNLNNIRLAQQLLNNEIESKYKVISNKLILLEIKTNKNNLNSAIIDFFSIINNYPNYYDFKYNDFSNSKKPVISCIILLTMNDLFVKNQLIPSIIKNSIGEKIEIIIVDNSEENRVNKFKNFKYIKSNAYHISKALNKGAKYSKGEYLAFFQDDVILDDSQWIKKSLKKLNDTTYAVSTKIDNIVARNELLIIKKKIFEEINGYDENIFTGQEEIDLSFNIFSRGKKIEKINTKTQHLGAISTILLTSSKSKEINELVSYNILCSSIIKKLRDYYLNKIKKQGIDIEFIKNYLYLRNKYLKKLIKYLPLNKINEYIPLKVDKNMVEKDLKKRYKNYNNIKPNNNKIIRIIKKLRKENKLD